MEIMKKCSECGRLLPLSEFNKLRRSKDGHQSRCRQCFSNYNKRRYASDPNKYKDAVKRYREENPENELETRIKTCEKNPSHKNAYRVVDAALRCGVLIKPGQCSICGCDESNRRIEAHHYDYRKPLSVVWLCSMCHDKADQLRREQEGLPVTSSAKAVIMSRNGEVLCRFDSIANASRAVGLAPSTISACLAGASKTAGGFNWSYETEDKE